MNMSYTKSPLDRWSVAKMGHKSFGSRETRLGHTLAAKSMEVLAEGGGRKVHR